MPPAQHEKAVGQTEQPTDKLIQAFSRNIMFLRRWWRPKYSKKKKKREKLTHIHPVFQKINQSK